MLKNKKKVTILILLFLLVTSTIFVVMSKNSQVEALSRYGSRGEEVRQIQDKLKRWGYYSRKC